MDELDRANRLVDSSLFFLDSPNNLGNPDASVQSLRESSKELAQKIAALMASAQSGKVTHP